ncbi:DUF349 domain-containing protein [Hymenobacter defluvii]|uniref:DUF349 domain-containing protein n=1 Tax=Hymenobacter defluvii TaxID=2054411 RepID=A0ABS3T7V7_9BACT|nr:DUF349 domain-containing protein [Hymenobacter defluvii]MBO3269727.1 DUF349 domain-containing protein [Hymenobacter defluvii]
MQPENPNTAPQSPENAAETPQSILERRLAEISAQKQPTTTPDADSETEQIQERPAQGTPALPEGTPPGAGTAEPEPDATPAPAPGSAESPADVEPETTPPASDISASQQRAQAHEGAQNDAALADTASAPAASVATEEPTTPHGIADIKEIEEHVPHVSLSSAEAIEQAPEGVAMLSTSAETPVSGESVVAEEADTTTDETSESEDSAAAGPDFSSLSLPEQGTYLLGLLRDKGARKNRKRIFDFNRQYETAVAADRTAAQQRFVDEGNPADAFAYLGPEGYAEVGKAVQDFRESRARDAKAEDEERARNLTHKQHLLAQLRQLVESAETKDSSARLKALQNDWKAIGPVPQQDSQELWNNYHALLDIYYNNRGLFFEMKELDRRRNQEAKEALIVRAEGLSAQSNVNKALQELRLLHEEWKNIGPVPNEQREPLWARFLTASEQVHARKQELLDARGTQERENLTRKQALLERLQPLADFQTERVNEWRAKTDELQKLKEEWDATGLVPRQQAEAINKQFWAGYKGFFQRKNQFFKAMDEEKNANLKRKQEMCEQAEAALANPNWEEGREIVIRLQKEWKTVGRVPEKQSDKIWNRFRTACDAFFERKHEESRQRQQQQQQVSQEQSAYLDQLEESIALLTPEAPGTLEGFRQQAAEWRTQAGASGGRGADRAEEKFQSLMGQYLDAVPGVSYSERANLLFQLQVERLKASPDSQQALHKQEQTLRREINELENDIATLQTNLDFFARSKNADQLRGEYQGRIDEAKVRIEQLKKQLKVVRS